MSGVAGSAGMSGAAGGAAGGAGMSGAAGGAAASGGMSGAAGGGAGRAGAPGTAGNAAATALGHPSAAVVSDAIAAALSSYHRNATTGDIWCLPCDGAPVMLAIAAYTGDTSADTRLLQQLRQVITTGNDPFATGGYAANDERNATAMYAIAKRTSRVWSQLSAAEVHKIDLVMTATLVADVYMTADKTNVKTAPLDLTGSNDSNRDFNPNYREGMIGAVLVGAEYFGGQQATEALLAAYDHAAFITDLQTNGLTNLYWTFSTYQRTPTSGAPNAATVEAGLQGYAMHGITLGQLLDMYVYLASDTFSATVACGLDAGAGILVGSTYAGRIVAGCAGLPSLGAVGMEKEFDSVDGNGARSDAGYVRLGLRTNLMNQLVLLVYGDWKDTAASATALQHAKVGVADFFYKASNGYESYSHGTDEGLFKCVADMDCTLNEAFWTEVLAPAHGL